LSKLSGMVVRRRLFSIASMLGLSALVLSQFQNCAPAGQLSSEDSASRVKVVDDFNKAQIRFGTEDIEVGDVSSMAEINGQCHHQFNGSVIQWSIWSETGDPVVSGETECKGGQFHVRLEDLEQFVCGEGHQLAVQAEGIGTASVTFIRRCPPIASRPVEVRNQTPYGTYCAIEYSRVPVLGRESPCSRVCYRENVIMSQTPEEDAACSAMIADLAGP